MTSMKSIKQRINNVSTTKQIMKAMDMVAAAKLQKARRTLEAARPFFHETKEIIDLIKNNEEAKENIFIKQRKVKNSAYIIITSDRGLCGSYNINVSEEALNHMNVGRNEQVFIIGSKGYEYFKRRNKYIVRRITDVSEAQIFEGSKLLSSKINDLYTAGKVDEVFIAYTHFESTLNYIPRVERLLPISNGEEKTKGNGSMRYEPNVHLFLEHAMPLYLHAYIYWAMAESLACEHASRMINMDSASKNATEVIDDLNRMYHRKRQAEITQELNEIVGGANILK